MLYLARRSGLRLTMRPRYPLRDPVSGQLTGHTKGVFIGFRDGVVRIPKTGEFVAVDTLDGGESEPIPAEEIHSWLEGHRLFGNQEEGFWRYEATAPPVSQEEMEALMQASIELNRDMLQEIVRQEEAGWQRPQILEPAKKALATVEQMEQSQQEAQAEAAAPKKPGPKPKAQGPQE